MEWLTENKQQSISYICVELVIQLSTYEGSITNVQTVRNFLVIKIGCYFYAAYWIYNSTNVIYFTRAKWDFEFSWNVLLLIDFIGKTTRTYMFHYFEERVDASFQVIHGKEEQKGYHWYI